MSLTTVALLLLALGRVELEDYYRIESADEPAISPDGRVVVFTRRWIDEEKNERRSELWLADASGEAPARRLTLPEFGASSPRFSPDGRHLAFRSRRGERSSIQFLRVDSFGEAFSIESVEEMPVFSPDGRSIAYTRKTPPEAPRPAPGEREKRIEERFEGRIYDWIQYRFDGRGYLPDPTDPHETPPREIYVHPLSGGEPRRLTSLGFDATEIAWSPDGLKLVFVADAHQRDERVYERSDLWLVDVAGDGAVTRLTDDGFHHSSPAFSPDGRRIAFRRQKGLSSLIAEKATKGSPLDVLVMDLPSREVANVTSSWDLRPEKPLFSIDGSQLSFEAEISGGRHLFRAPADGTGSVTQVTNGDRQIEDVTFSRDWAWMAYSSETATAPSDVYVSRMDGGAERRLSSFGADSVDGLSVRAPERVVYPSRDGTRIEGWILLPEADGRSPLVLAIHGGPHGAYGHRFTFQFQLWAASGYAVLYTNPRGSTGYGEDFLWATWGGGWGNLDGEDVLAGVDFALDRYRLDGSRLGVTGYSYGGFLTNWILTQDARFDAAIVGAGISNWVSDYGTADIPRTKESEFYGPPWEDESGSLLRRQSPILYVQNVVTPALFVHGETDFRVPIEQGEQMYLALRKRGVPAKFIRYPDSYHGGWTPWNTVHRYHHELLWWARHLDPGSTDGR
jgi:dipeptidyl aminopeptidase/acylaminoacyl peptidase